MPSLFHQKAVDLATKHQNVIRKYSHINTAIDGLLACRHLLLNRPEISQIQIIKNCPWTNFMQSTNVDRRF